MIDSKIEPAHGLDRRLNGIAFQQLSATDREHIVENKPRRAPRLHQFSGDPKGSVSKRATSHNSTPSLAASTMNWA
jgi:hypothetical protein